MSLLNRPGPALALGLVLVLAGCGGFGSAGSGFFGGGRDGVVTAQEFESSRAADAQRAAIAASEEDDDGRSTLWDLFRDSDNPNTTVEVNKYLWQASLEVLNFLPIESVDRSPASSSPATACRPAVAAPIAQRFWCRTRRWMPAA